MKPINFPEVNVTYAKDQPEYQPLPAFKSDDPMGQVVSCWELSLKERFRILFTGKLWVMLASFHRPLTPSFLSTKKSDVLTKPPKKKKYRGEYADQWINFYWGWVFDISYETCGYFDARHRINIDLIFFSLTIILPIWSKMTDECDPPKYGISYHHQTLWIHRGGKGNMNGGNKWWTMYMPWSFQWVRTSALRKDGTWEHSKKGNDKSFWEDKWKDVLLIETHPYTYKLRSGEIQERLATIKVKEREWRWHWMKWSPFPRKISRDIDVSFNEEVGEGTGSWKGGVTGCGYPIKKGETPLECLRRMEAERKFNR